MNFETIQVDALTPNIGAEINGIDLSQPLDSQTFREVHRALMEHQVIFFRDQRMSIDEHKAFARWFGELHIHPMFGSDDIGHPELLVIRSDESTKFAAGSGGWHSDVSCDPEPPMGSILYLTEAPKTGGDTLFASMYAAYEGLSSTMQQLLLGLTAVHSAEKAYDGRQEQRLQRRDETPPFAEHPVVRTHPVTGRKSLFVNEIFCSHLKGMTTTESKAILGMLYEHIRQPKYHCRFNWRENSVAFWDNRCAQHYAMFDYYPQVRHGYRFTVKGDRPL
jgi:taurine dioxygenase